MRALVIVLVLGAALSGCGGKSRQSSGGGPATPAVVATAFPAARFVPAQPTYVVSATTMRDAQAAFTHVIDMVGMTAGFEVSEASRGFSELLGVDPLSADAVAAIGVDLEGSVAMFSEDVSPTFVLHLKSPDAMQGFLDGQRQSGMRTQSVIVGGTEVFTARLDSSAHISWAIDNDWMWIHFSIGRPDGTEWFEHSRTPTSSAWADGWSWAKALSGAAAHAPAIVGIFDPNGMFAKLSAKSSDALACGQQFASVRRIGLNFDIDDKSVAAQLAVDLGDASGKLRALMLAPPVGWAAAAANAPIAAEWNVDLPATASFVELCTGDPELRGAIAQLGLRTFRAFAHSLDIGEKEGVGAISADLSSASFFRGILDQIPGRSMAESSRTFGQYKGKHVKVPFFVEADYVLTDELAIAAMGNGVLAKIGTTGSAAAAPAVLALDVRPQGMPAGVWLDLFQVMDLPEPKRLVQRLQLWAELHLDGHLDNSALVIKARGTRR